MNTEEKYNYQHFDPKDYDFINFKGPKAGEPYIDFMAQTLDEKEVYLSDYLDKSIVLETGSITCPMYANTTTPMNELQKLYPSIHFLLLYVREAHPGKRTKGVSTIEEKLSNANSTRKFYNESREVLVDDLEGTAHKLYGSMPNMTYLIGTDGMVKFRANWSNVEKLKEVLKNIESNPIETQDYFEVIKPSPYVAIRTLLIGGFGALYEFVTGLPQLLRQHKEADEVRKNNSH